MRLLPFVIVLAIGIAGCRETAHCPDGQHYHPVLRQCGAPFDSGVDAADGALVDGGQDAGPPCGGECVDDAHCDRDTDLCIECLDDAECGVDPDQPICLAGTCSRCETDEQCAGAHPARPNCTMTGACVACDPANEVTLCGTAATCDVPSGACVSIAPGARRICEPCGSDLQCEDGLFCVPMTFMGTARDGGYCLPPQGSTLCVSPYRSLLSNRTTLSGIGPASYCGPNEELTTCDAVLAFVGSRACPTGDASECMAEGAVCATVGVATNQCSYNCSIVAECPGGQPCRTTCGAP